MNTINTEKILRLYSTLHVVKNSKNTKNLVARIRKNLVQGLDKSTKAEFKSLFPKKPSKRSAKLTAIAMAGWLMGVLQTQVEGASASYTKPTSTNSNNSSEGTSSTAGLTLIERKRTPNLENTLEAGYL